MKEKSLRSLSHDQLKDYVITAIDDKSEDGRNRWIFVSMDKPCRAVEYVGFYTEKALMSAIYTLICEACKMMGVEEVIQELEKIIHIIKGDKHE